MDSKTAHIRDFLGRIMSGSLKRKTLRWYVDTNAWNPTRSEWIVAMRMVGNDFERDRINRFVYKKDAKHALVGRLLIRKCCEYFLGSKKFCLHHPDDRNLFGDQLVLERSEKGKPILMEIDENGNHQPYQDFQFNISHSGDYCVLAADTATKKLGIDIMKIEYSGGMCKINEFFNTMRRQFSEEEWRFIRNSQTDWGKLARFIRLWSLKESFVKAEGSGIIFPLSKISFECRSELVAPSQKNRFDSIVKINNRYSKYWSFEESMIDPRHYVSVARLRYTKNFDNKTDDVDRNPIDDDDDYEDDGDDDDGDGDLTKYQFRKLTIKDLIGDYQLNSYKELDTKIFDTNETTKDDLMNTINFEDQSYWVDFCGKS